MEAQTHENLPALADKTLSLDSTPNGEWAASKLWAGILGAQAIDDRLVRIRFRSSSSDGSASGNRDLAGSFAVSKGRKRGTQYDPEHHLPPAWRVRRRGRRARYEGHHRTIPHPGPRHGGRARRARRPGQVADRLG